MEKKESIIILGGSRPHAELIKYLRSKNYRTILVDYLPNPPAKDVADIHYQDSSLDVEAVERIAKEEMATHIMCICTDRAIPPAAYVAERLHLPHPYSYDTSLIATNKNKMKSMLCGAGIPTSRFFQINSVSQIDEIKLKFPLIVKPSDASGSIGITKVDKIEDLKSAVEYALQTSRNGQAIVEEFIVGTEIQMDCFISDGQLYILDIKEKRKMSIEELSLSFGSLIPARISDQQKNRCVEISNKTAESLKIANGPLYIQAIANEADVFVVEFGLRFGGNLSFKILKDISGVDIIKATAEAYLGLSNEIHPFTDFKDVYATFHIFPKKGQFKCITGYEQLLNDGTLEVFHINKSTGLICEGNMTSKERLASFIIRSKSIEGVNRKLRRVLEEVEVLDEQNKPIMRKDIYVL